MPKENTAPVIVESKPEILPLKSVWAYVDSRGFKSKTVIIDLPDEYTPQIISDNPRLFRTIQADRNRALNAGDKVELWWFDKAGFATADYADNAEVVFLKMDIRTRRVRDREPYSDGTYAVRPQAGKWAAFRISDGVRMGGYYDSWQAARGEIYSLTGVSR